MGCVSTITAYDFPKQSQYVNRRCKVCFHYDTSKWIMGTVIRDDREEPFETLIQLDDGRTMRGVECQYLFSETDDQSLRQRNEVAVDSDGERHTERAGDEAGHRGKGRRGG